VVGVGWFWVVHVRCGAIKLIALTTCVAKFPALRKIPTAITNFNYNAKTLSCNFKAAATAGEIDFRWKLLLFKDLISCRM